MNILVVDLNEKCMILNYIINVFNHNLIIWSTNSKTKTTTVAHRINWCQNMLYFFDFGINIRVVLNTEIVTSIPLLPIRYLSILLLS